MRALLCTSALCFGLAATSAAAADPQDGSSKKPGGKGGSIGLGIVAGDPVGASLKWFVHPHHALQAQVGWGPLHHGDGLVSIEYLYHSKSWGSTDIVDTFGYVGLGVGGGREP